MKSEKNIIYAGLRNIFIALALIAFHSSLFTSCKEYTTDCRLTVMPRRMVTQGSDEHGAANMVRLYAWYVGEADAHNGNWRPGSYADADAGIVRHRVTGETLPHGLLAEQSDEDTYIHMTVSRSPVLLVAVDPISRFYAWRTFIYEIPLDEVRFPVTFKVWQWAQPYKENEWTVTSERYESGEELRVNGEE